MSRNCKGSQPQRLLSKFTENDDDKFDRLVELNLKYLDKLEIIDRDINQQSLILIGGDKEVENKYLKRLSGGLFGLEMIDYIILEVSAIKQCVIQILNIRSAPMKSIRNVSAINMRPNN
ncbi:hypothetical protein GQX74_009467 [Glossina fuscipes]|nr:hypothetical protein GQX74_009467 [Glossina fuscipes]